jgi:hypothetical protein
MAAEDDSQPMLGRLHAGRNEAGGLCSTSCGSWRVLELISELEGFSVVIRRQPRSIDPQRNVRGKTYKAFLGGIADQRPESPGGAEDVIHGNRRGGAQYHGRDNRTLRHPRHGHLAATSARQ